MSSQRMYLPSSSTLVAFECVARLQGVGRAAAEMNTSQSAVSRHIRQLEQTLGTPLFAKAGRGIALTAAGKSYYSAVAPALEAIHRAGRALRVAERHVIIACTHEVSHMVIMPRFAEMRRALGPSVQVRVLTCDYELVPDMVDAGADITFEFSQGPFHKGSAAVLPEEVVPVAAPGFVNRHQGVLRRGAVHWGGLPLLELTKNNSGWATWEDWFRAEGAGPPPAPAERFDNYAYLLEAAASGAGLALGWRGFVDRYLTFGTLVQACERWLTQPTYLAARLTAKGLRNGSAEKCLTVLAELDSAGIERP